MIGGQGRASLRGWFAARPLAIDLALVTVALLVAGVLRLALLGDVPYGLHPDEAQVGTDAARILDGDPPGAYTTAALGQPSGHAYLATPFVAVLGHEIIAIRLPLALTGLAAIPLLYAFARVTLGRPEAFFAAMLLATSYWHLLYSRVAHWSISYGTIALAVALCVVIGLQRRSRGWLVAGGAIAGLGAYTYNIYAIAVAALAVAIAIITAVCVEREDRGWWLRSVGLAAVVALTIALPMVVVVADPGSEFWDHAGDYSESGLLRSDEFREGSLAEKASLAAGQAKRFAATYTYDARFDLVDANGLRPVFDPLTLLLLAAGLVFAWTRRGNPAIIIALCCIVIIPLPAVLQRGSVMRQPLAAAPFAMLIAALPLAWAWRWGGRTADVADVSDGAVERAGRASKRQLRPHLLRVARVGLRVGTIGLVAAIAAITVRDYFWQWRDSDGVRFVYHDEVTAAAYYMRDLPDGTYVYFYSERHPLRLETIEFLAPDVEGEDRSGRWAIVEGDSIERIRRDVPVSLVILGPYVEQNLLGEVEARYPGGRVVAGIRDNHVDFVAYELDADRDAEAPSVPVTPP